MNPYPYQRRCLSALWSAYRSGRGSALFQMATGLGKTVTAGLFLKRWLEERLGRILVLCHQNYLIDQLHDRITHVVGERYSSGLYYGRRRAVGRPDMLFGSFQTMLKRRERFGADEFSLVLVDEAHHGKADTYEPTLRYFTPRFLMGMTATVERDDGRDIRELFGPEVFSLGTADALAQGLLSPVRYCLFLDSNRTLDEALGGVEPEKCSIRAFEERFFDHRTEEEISRILVERMSRVRGSRALIFGSDVAQCNRIHRLLAPHIPAAALHYEVDDEDRRTRLEAFRSGELRVLSTRDMLNEGIDVPEVTLTVFLRATGSRRIFLQQLGRALRRHADKDEVEVLDFVANCERLMLVQDFEREVRDAEGRSRHGRPVGGGRFAIHDGDAAVGADFVQRLKDVVEVLSRIETGWTNESAIEALQRLYAEKKAPISCRDVEAASTKGLSPCTEWLRKRFDPEGRSFIPAMRAAGVPAVSDGKPKWRKDSALEALRQLHATLKRPISNRDIENASKENLCPSIDWFRKRFDPERRSHIPALKAAGVPSLARPRPAWTGETAIEAIRKLHRAKGAPLSTTDVQEASKKGECPSPGWIRKHFDPEGDSLESALRAMGVPPRGRGALEWTRATGLSALRTLHGKLGKPLTLADIVSAMKRGLCPGPSWLKEEFDPEKRSLLPALEAAGVPGAIDS